MYFHGTTSSRTGSQRSDYGVISRSGCSNLAGCVCTPPSKSEKYGNMVRFEMSAKAAADAMVRQSELRRRFDYHEGTIYRAAILITMV